jgi:Zn-dependent protease with chaperone function
MTVSYLCRLLCLCGCFLTFFWALCEAVLWMAAPRVQRWLARKPAETESTLLFCLLVAPLALSIGLTLTVCIPAYIAAEQNTDVERVGGLTAWVAALALLIFVLGCLRGMRALIRTQHVTAAYKGETRLLALNGKPLRLNVIEGAGLAISVVGLLHPKIIISRVLLESFSREELEVALAHEQAHSLRRDNLKRLLVHILPSFLLFSARRTALHQAWSEALEYSADLYAVSRGGALPRERANRGLTLARVLVAVARESSRLDTPFASALGSSSEQHLCRRIDRLLEPDGGATTEGSVILPLASGVFFSLCFLLSAGTFHATAGSLPMQALVERLLHL